MPERIYKCQCGGPICNQHRLGSQGSVGFDLETATLYAHAEDLAREGGFLLDRLDDHARNLRDDFDDREFQGHVAPSIARFRRILADALGKSSE